MKKEQLNRRRTGRIAKKKYQITFSFIPNVKTNSNNDGESTDDTNIEEEEERRKRR